MGGGKEYPGARGTRPADDKEPKDPVQEVNVLITSFGPFPDGKGGQYTLNASHEIARRLPSLLSTKSHLNGSSASINIVNPTAGENDYIPTEYAEIRKRIKALHEEYAQSVDLFVHLGQADGWHHLTVEKTAFKEGMSSTWFGPSEEEKYYTTPDNAGKTINDLGPCPWEGVPIGLDTALPVDAIVEAANSALKDNYKHPKGKHHSHSDDSDDSSDSVSVSESANSDFEAEKKKKKKKDKKKKKKGKKDKKHPKGPQPLEVRQHAEAGSYGCGFSYYESLANRYVQFRKRDVLFCHTPGELDEENLGRARDAVLAVIGAAVEELMKGKAAERKEA